MSVVGGLFSDVFKSQNMAVPGVTNTIDWSKAGGNPADLNWDNIKPFQVMPPMSWAATNKEATAPEEAKAKLDGIESTDNRSEYQKWLDSQNQSKGGGGDRDRTGGLAGNGTNFTDDQWASIKSMNDQFGFFGNPVNKIGLGALAQLAMPGSAVLMGLSGENPLTAQQRSVDAINNFQNGLWGGGGFGTSVANGGAGVTAPTGAGVAANPMGVDPATAAQGNIAAAAQREAEMRSYRDSLSQSYGGVTDGSDGRSYGISGGEGE